MSTGNAPGTRIYMDANATTPLLPEVVEAMRPYWIEQFGNASSIHLDAQQARTGLDRARETLAEFFNCHDAEVVFNSGGTEGDNTARTWRGSSFSPQWPQTSCGAARCSHDAWIRTTGGPFSAYQRSPQPSSERITG